MTLGISPTNQSWLLDEDDALKDKLSGFSVKNPADGRLIPIQVYFRFPDAEENTRRFPNFAIDQLAVEFDPTRAHRADGYIQPIDLEQTTPMFGYNLVADDMPLPYNIIYQIAAYSRNPRHDRQLSQLLGFQFPEQFGSLTMTNYDGTVRRADLVSVARRDTVDQDKKRLYRNIFTISVSTELYISQVVAIQQITSVALDASVTRATAK